jgi:hypothetical protein
MDLKACCDAIEECYEFMLAYAAQGIVEEAGHQSSGQLRTLLHRAEDAMARVADECRQIVERERLEPADRYATFINVLERDAQAALAVVRLVSAQPSLSSQLIDNLNASIHVRTLLTDLFLIDDILKKAANTQPAS